MRFYLWVLPLSVSSTSCMSSWGFVCGFHHFHCLVQVVCLHGVLSVGSTSFSVHCLAQVVGLHEVLSVGSTTFTV